MIRLQLVALIENIPLNIAWDVPEIFITNAQVSGDVMMGHVPLLRIERYEKKDLSSPWLFSVIPCSAFIVRFWMGCNTSGPLMPCWEATYIDFIYDAHLHLIFYLISANVWCVLQIFIFPQLFNVPHDGDQLQQLLAHCFLGHSCIEANEALSSVNFLKFCHKNFCNVKFNNILVRGYFKKISTAAALCYSNLSMHIAGFATSLSSVCAVHRQLDTANHYNHQFTVI